jgi:hypothetical protein
VGAPALGMRALGMRVQKTGRTSGYTSGTVTQVDVTIRIDYYGPTAVFDGQVVLSPLSQPGDSGAAVLDEGRRVVGLIFSGSGSATVMNPIQDVLEALEVEVVT